MSRYGQRTRLTQSARNVNQVGTWFGVSFTAPLPPLIVDFLVVAGGGGGGVTQTTAAPSGGFKVSTITAAGVADTVSFA
jgi:hypothetical protein